MGMRKSLYRRASRQLETRDLERDASAAGRRVSGPDPALVRLDDRPGDREAEAAAARARGIGPVEAIEDELALARRDPRPVVVDHHPQVAAGGDRGDSDDAVDRGVLDRVADHVPEHLREAIAVGDQAARGGWPD